MEKTIQSLSKLGNSRIILPALTVFLLFVWAVFGVALPIFKENLVEQKKKSIAHLTQTIWSILEHYESRIKLGDIELEKAQYLAKEQIKELRYGSQRKNYFWISDTHPRMIMHPYHPELEQQDLSKYIDKTGKFIFMEITQSVIKNEASFVPYFWQWNDSPGRISPKLSYLKIFRPWGWVVGTGIYIDDVTSEIDKVSKKLVYFSVIILVIVALILTLMIRKNMDEILKRHLSEEELDKYQKNLEIIVEKRTDELSRANMILKEERQQLQNALSEIKVLRGILPICSFCKKIRDDKGYWNQVEVYVKKHSEANFSHSFCPECAKKHYPQFFVESDKRILV